MSQVFVSYKREDEPRVAKLVRAIERAGISVWWDRGLPAGEEWRAKLEQELLDAKVVVVCWSFGSVGPEGAFVRDEAVRATSKLLPVRLDNVTPPLGFGEVQAIDLFHWGGQQRDPALQDVLATIRAKIAGVAAPKPRAPAARALRRFIWGGGASAALVGLAALFWSAPTARSAVCSAPIAQPALGNACCSIGFTQRELVRSDDFVSTSIVKLGYLRQDSVPSATEAEARRIALVRLVPDASELCSVTEPYQRLMNTTAEPLDFSCQQAAGGFLCGLNYRAVCTLEERALVEVCPAN